MATSRRTPRLADPVQAAAHLGVLLGPRVLEPLPTVLIVLCDERSRPLVHVEVDECDPDPAPSDCAGVLEVPLDVCEREPDVRGLLIALARPGSAQVQEFDRVWFRSLHRVCHLRGLTALGVYVVGRDGTRAVHIDDAA